MLVARVFPNQEGGFAKLTNEEEGGTEESQNLSIQELR